MTDTHVICGTCKGEAKTVANPQPDDEVTCSGCGQRDRFEDVYEEAIAGGLEDWKSEARSCLALILVLDQFPRNMFRGDGRTYAADGLALVTWRPRARLSTISRSVTPPVTCRAWRPTKV